MEQARRKSLKLICGETLALPTKQMDSTYDSTDERECELCKYDLHLSAVGCECCPDKFACLLHGHLLCPCPWSKKTLLYRYHLEQLTLLLAAVEGRPGAVANWIKHDAQQTVQSSPSLRDVLSSQDKLLPGDDNLKRPHSCASSTVVGTSPQFDSTTSTVTKEMAMQSANVLAQASRSEPGFMTQPFPSPLISVRSTAQVGASCDNSNVPHYNSSLGRQESKDVLSHPQKVVSLKSGARKDVPGQAGSDGVILLSDDEEEITSCKLNETGESSFSVHEKASNVPSRVVECATDNGLEGRAYQVESKGDTRYRSLAHDPTIQVGYGSSSAKRDPSQGSIEAAFAGGNMKQLATGMAVRSPINERAVHTLPSASMHGTERLDERISFPRPMNDLVTVVQRSTGSSWTPPRVARVRVKREVDLLHVGRLVVREGWHTRHAIYPAGNPSFLPSFL